MRLIKHLDTEDILMMMIASAGFAFALYPALPIEGLEIIIPRVSSFLIISIILCVALNYFFEWGIFKHYAEMKDILPKVK